MERPIKSEIRGANRKIINKKYNIALKKYNDWKKSQKPKSKDPRPTYSDKKYKNYNEFRQDVLAWRERNKKPKEKRLNPRDRKFNSQKLKVKKKSKDSVEEYVSKRKNEKGIEKVKYPVQTSKVKGEEKKIVKKEEKPFKNRVTGGSKTKSENKNTGGGESKTVVKPKPAEKLYAKYRRTKEEGIGKGDTRTTKKLKKAGFTETRLAKLRKEHADWKAKRKKKKKS